MPTNVAKVPNLPILLTTIAEGADLQTLFDTFARNLELTRLHVDPVFWVIDVHSARTTFASNVSAWVQIAQGLSKSPLILGQRMAFVGDTVMLPFFSQLKLTAFSTVEEATAYALRESAQPYLTAG